MRVFGYLAFMGFYGLLFILAELNGKQSTNNRQKKGLEIVGALRCIYGVGVFVLFGFAILHFTALLFTSYTRRRCKVSAFLG